MRNANPKGAISLRFAIDVGSYEEADPSAGWRTSSNTWPSARRAISRNGATDRVFAPWGVAFGRDQNAATTTFSTTYQLDMPKPDQAQLKTGFAWLRDVADGIVFSDEAVNWSAASCWPRWSPAAARCSPPRTPSPSSRARASDRSIASPSERGRPSKPPGGADLKRFYDAWYRPEHAVVTVVGDMPVEDMRAMVESAFSSWSGRGPKPVRAKIAQPPPGRPQDALSLDRRGPADRAQRLRDPARRARSGRST